MRLAMPFALLLLLLAPLVIESPWREKLPFLRRRARSTVPTFQFSTAVPLDTLPQSLRAQWRGPILTVGRLLSLLLLVIALARPQTTAGLIETDASGRDILMVVDVSGSMEAMDFLLEGERVERLTALKAIVKEFVEGRRGDRIGLVVFGDEVFTQCPLTLDHRVVNDFVDGLEVGMAGKGTAMGDGIAVGLKRIMDIEADSKVLVLVTDGMRTAGQIDPMQAAAIAAQLGVKVYTVGIGGVEPAPFKSRNIFGIETFEYRDVPLDEPTLKEIAKVTGGMYFHAAQTEELRNVYASIDRLEQRVDKTYDYIDYEEAFLPFLLSGFALFFVVELCAATLLAVVP
ncbi:MAG: VWA domain-containing protein [Bdellovibrionales bacterium]|nr:VWA domain-containing protein [Bdellovibrionales bacterium]